MPSPTDIEAALSGTAASMSAADDEDLLGMPGPLAADGYEGIEAPARRRSWWKHVE